MGQEPLKPRASRRQEFLKSFFHGISGLELSLPFRPAGRWKMK